MTSTTSSVSPGGQTLGVFRWQLRRSAGITAVYTAILALAFPVLLLFTLSGRDRYYYGGISEAQMREMTERSALSVTLTATMLGITAMIFFALVFTLTNFGFLHKKREVDLFHAMPVNRGPLFYGRFLSGCVCLFLPLLLALLLQGIVAACFGMLTPDMLNLLFCVLLQLLVTTAVVFSFTVFVAVCSGSTMDTLVSIVLISVTYPALILVGTAVINSTIPSVSLDFSARLAGALSPLAAAYLQFVGFQAQGGTPAASWLFTLWLAFLTAALLLGAAAMYRRRKSESAESAVSFGPSKVVIRIFSCAAGGLCFGYLLFQLTDSTLSYYLGTLLFSALAYLVTELLYWKTLKQLFRHSLPYCGVLAIFLAFLLTVSLGAFGMDTYVPSAVQVQSVVVTNDDLNRFGTTDTPAWTEEEAAQAAKQGYVSYESISAAVQSPELIDKTREANEKFIAYERTRQYPYLIGRDKRSDWLGHYFLTYHFAGADDPITKTHTLYPGVGEEAEALYTEAGRLAGEVLTSDEYITGLYPVNAVDAATWVTRYEHEDEGPDGDRLAASTDSGPGTIEFSSLKNESGFREELEQCLMDDFRNGRWSNYDETTEATYEIMYSEGKRFTARGGLRDGMPVKGRSFLLSGSMSYTVSPNMTSTYQLLESLYS